MQKKADGVLSWNQPRRFKRRLDSEWIYRLQRTVLLLYTLPRHGGRSKVGLFKRVSTLADQSAWTGLGRIDKWLALNIKTAADLILF
jgi:hypothetical protein